MNMWHKGSWGKWFSSYRDNVRWC